MCRDFGHVENCECFVESSNQKDSKESLKQKSEIEDRQICLKFLSH